MKLRAIALGLLMVVGLACGEEEPQTDQKQGAITFSCGGASVATQNPSTQGTIVWTLPGLTWHSHFVVSNSLQNKTQTNGILFVEIDRPTEAPGGTWPLFTTGTQINGNSIRMIMPGEVSGLMYYFEGQTSFSGPFPGGSVFISGIVYNGKHQLLGTFSTSSTSGGSPQWLNGSQPVCASPSAPTLKPSFGYNLELPGGTNWFQGTVTSQQSGGYVQLHLSNPNYQTHETWIGDAACIIDVNRLLNCNIHTGQDQFSSDIGDPLWTLKSVDGGTLYQYAREWDFEWPGLYMDMFNML